MYYASYYAVVFGHQNVFLSPVMGVSDQPDGRKHGYVCIHPFGVHDALHMIDEFIDSFLGGDDSDSFLFGELAKKHVDSNSLFADSEVMDHLDSFMSSFLSERFFERELDGEDKIDSLFYYGSWLEPITFDPGGGYLIIERELPCEYRTQFGVFSDSFECVFGLLVIPRAEMLKLLEDLGLVFS
jgi:hypothetical protein